MNFSGFGKCSTCGGSGYVKNKACNGCPNPCCGECDVSRHFKCPTCQGSGITATEQRKIEVPEGYEYLFSWNEVVTVAVFQGKTEKNKLRHRRIKYPYPQGHHTFICETCKGKECKETCTLKKERGCGKQCFPANMPCPFCKGNHTIEADITIEVIKIKDEWFFKIFARKMVL